MAGLIATVGFLLARLLVGDPAHVALLIACACGLAVIALGGAIQSLWSGDQVEEAEAAGVRLKFSTSRRAIAELDSRVGLQLAETNERVRDLERAVFTSRDPRFEE